LLISKIVAIAPRHSTPEYGYLKLNHHKETNRKESYPAAIGPLKSSQVLTAPVARGSNPKCLQFGNDRLPYKRITLDREVLGGSVNVLLTVS
jgi:hypothetical protein